jgi:hypothetical protein
MVLLAQKTSFDYDKTANFSAFKTYALRDGTKVGDPLVDKRIVAAIEAEMAAKGLTPAATTPDVTVVYHIAFDKRSRTLPRTAPVWAPATAGAVAGAPPTSA